MRLLATHSPGFDPETPWVESDTRTTAESRLFSQIAARRSSPHTSREHVFTRLICPDWVNVIASTQEIIGGVCEPGEDPHLSARRELLEETGHATEHWISLGSCEPNPAVQNNRCHFYLALDCRAVAELDLDPSEELRVWAYGWEEWRERMASGGVTHSLVLAAFLRLTLWEGWGALQGRRRPPSASACLLLD